MRIRGWAVAGCGAEIMGFGPSPATRRLMDRLNIDVQSIDLIELNEAFAAQALAVMNDLRLDRPALTSTAARSLSATR